MKKLLSLPPNLVSCFHKIENVSKDEYFCISDPIGSKLGSGGGTGWLLKTCHETWDSQTDFATWLAKEKRILLHAGGQSRRLPSYAPSGKILTPIPVFRWERGQRISQNLLQLQLPLYERILKQAPQNLHTLIASGDVYIRAGKLQQIPEADVVCYGLWVSPTLATNHGVFVSDRRSPERLDYMLQKPSVETLGKLMSSHFFLMDIGVWLLSDRAVELLLKRCTEGDHFVNYDLYGEFGCCLGDHPKQKDEELAQLKVAILPLQDGEFYHYGTSREMISSTVSVQNRVYDQRAIMHLGVKPHPSIFIQNSHKEIQLTSDNQNTWIENSWIGKGWKLSSNHIITGVPQNEWKVDLQEEICIDVIPLNDKEYVLRPYGMNDSFRGGIADPSTTYLGMPAKQWLSNHNLSPSDIQGSEDMQSSALFPVSCNIHDLGLILNWMLTGIGEGKDMYRNATKLSANEISDKANLLRLQAQRMMFLKENLSELANNHKTSVFYQTNLADMAKTFKELNVPLPPELDKSEPLLKRISDHMFRSQLQSLRGEDGSKDEREAFALLSEGLTANVVSEKQHPVKDVHSDQIVWGRSPVRIDLAGGWTDTPPYCLSNGGNVVNLAIELNGQPPLQTYVKCSREYKIILRSIDLGASEVVTTYEELADFVKVGSPFSIPKAALALAGFLPRFSNVTYSSLEEQLKDFGCGIEVTLLSAVPAGSGLGTSSILASTVLGAISDFCGLSWDKADICNRTLVLEQLLTTGGGWQDQYGGVLHGLKLLRTNPGFQQTPEIRWLPDSLYTDSDYASCHVLYYTGITRTAKKILAEIVRGMFLFDTHCLSLLDEMKEHAMDLYMAILRNDYETTGRLIGKTWKQNKALDCGTNPPEVESIIQRVKDYCLGYKLPGAGGGGFLYMVAKDVDAARKIRQELSDNSPNARARLVDMKLSQKGLQISRS